MNSFRIGIKMEVYKITAYSFPKNNKIKEFAHSTLFLTREFAHTTALALYSKKEFAQVWISKASVNAQNTTQVDPTKCAWVLDTYITEVELNPK